MAAISIPLSPSSGGALTPRARLAALKPDTPVTPVESERGLVTDLDQLAVRSPSTANANASAVPVPVAAVSTSGPHTKTSPQSPSILLQNVYSEEPVSNGASGSQKLPPPARQQHPRSYSTSTESSSSFSFTPPVSFGSMYNQDGFPNYPIEDGKVTSMQQAMRDEAIAKQVAQADEAIKQINGTATVVHAPINTGIGGSRGTPTLGNVFELPPRSFANFTRPQVARDPEHLVTRQSSTSSTTTEASTSSEESDLCIPTIEWVNTSVPASNSGYPFASYYSSYNPPARNGGSARSPKMPPPQTTGRGHVSPRRNGQNATSHAGSSAHQNASVPLGGSAATPAGLRQNSALPPGIPGEAPAEDDDDDQTVGHRDREQSPSTSSSTSGLDLLWQAVHHNQAGPHYDHHGKRKAGAEAVAQWRESGIPTGKPRASDVRPGYISPVKPGDPSRREASVSSGPPKKRRRSEMQLETPDVQLHDEAYGKEEGAMDTDGAAGESDDNSDFEEVLSGDDSEYGTGTAKHGRKIAGRPKPTKKGARGRPTLPAVPPATSKASSALAKKPRKVGTASPSGTAKGGRKLSDGDLKLQPGAHGSVRCEYVNPLPPFQQCEEFFTRKYDLPRHMARHARREGELVAEGKLAEEKAKLWRTIKDKPKVECLTCGESFTRMDALKRHQAKQHHH